ncbi:MAG: M28 family peptidase [Raineya sp.]|nr:M28 family peptidase [Raineya sp.]
MFFIFCFSKGITQDLIRVRNNLSQLCSPEFNGRGYVKKGDSLASAWIAQEFENIGLQKFQNSYFQNFNTSINTFPKEVSCSLDGKKLVLGKDFIVGADSPSAFGRAKVIFLDTLLFSDKNRRIQFFNQDFRKKAFVFPIHWTKKLAELNPTEIEKLEQAALWVSLHNKLTASVSTKQGKLPEIQVLQSAWKPNTKQITYKIRSKFIEKYPTRNVIGYLKGTIHSDTFVVFTAHYDHLGSMGNIYFPGANDNASGITMLLELAHYYKQKPSKYSVAFIAFAAEEAGLIGSQFYTQNPLFPLLQIKVLFNLDLVGTGDEGITVVNGAVFEKDFEILQKINEKYQLLPKIVKRGKAANSDHYFFSEKGVKAFFIYTLGGIKAYHDIDDKAETLPLTKYTEVFKLITEYIKICE